MLSVVVLRVLFFFLGVYARARVLFANIAVMIMTQINVINLLAIVLNAVTCGVRARKVFELSI